MINAEEAKKRTSEERAKRELERIEHDRVTKERILEMEKTFMETQLPRKMAEIERNIDTAIYNGSTEMKLMIFHDDCYIIDHKWIMLADEIIKRLTDLNYVASYKETKAGNLSLHIHVSWS